MARFLIDEALPRSVARRLRATGHDADDIRDLGLRGQPDERIFVEAQQRSAVLITPDLGFANILRFPPQSHSGLIIVRLPNLLSTDRVAEEIVRSLRELSATTLTSAIVVVEANRTRIRRFR